MRAFCLPAISGIRTIADPQFSGSDLVLKRNSCEINVPNGSERIQRSTLWRIPGRISPTDDSDCIRQVLPYGQKQQGRRPCAKYRKASTAQECPTPPRLRPQLPYLLGMCPMNARALQNFRERLRRHVSSAQGGSRHKRMVNTGLQCGSGDAGQFG